MPPPLWAAELSELRSQAGRQPVRVGRLGEMEHVVVDQTLLAQACGEAGAGAVAEHEQERPVTLEEIAGFLTANQLNFKGFIQEAEQVAAFHKRFPEPGSALKLENWTEFENDNPRLFDSMYRLWCERAA